MDNIFYNKLFIYNKQNIYSKIKIKKAYKKNITSDEINNDIFFKEIDEDIDIDDKSIGKNQGNYKFIDYLNEKSKNNNQFNETMPATTREFFDYPKNDNA